MSPFVITIIAIIVVYAIFSKNTAIEGEEIRRKNREREKEEEEFDKKMDAFNNDDGYDKWLEQEARNESKHNDEDYYQN